MCWSYGGIAVVFLPKRLGSIEIEPEILRGDVKHCRRFGPCGIGNEALYLNSFFVDRMYYIPIRSVRRIFKRVAMSRGGFTGKGMFASIPYLVVEYEDGREKQCIFRTEETVDQMIGCFHQMYPQVPVHSREAQKRLEEKQAEKERRKALRENCAARGEIVRLARAAEYLEKEPALYEQMSRAARQKRVQERTNPTYRRAALTFRMMGLAVFGYGIYALVLHLGGAMYFVLFGMAAAILFSSENMLPLRRKNEAYAEQSLWEAQDQMREYISKYPDFPVPAHYAHPIVLKWMQDILAEDRAKDSAGALEILKEDLRKLDSSVTVDQETYEEIMAIKPLFLVS
jgi:hypothetical protein